MPINTNKWNKIRYTFYTPIYDMLASILNRSRKKIIESLEIKEGSKILIIGAGTGLDLDFIPAHCQVTATDITPSMIKKIKQKYGSEKWALQALVMDGQQLDFQNEQFDYVFLHLILAVIPDPYACIGEAERVLKSGGTISVFDKFITDGHKVSGFRKLANFFTNLLFSDITRSSSKIIATTHLQIINETPADFNGIFKIIKLKKPFA